MNTLRSEILKKRKELTYSDVINKSALIVDKIMSLESVRNSDNLLVYLGYNNEVILDSLIEEYISSKCIFAPSCDLDGNMDFYRLYDMKDLIKGSYGIREPRKDNLFTKDLITDNTVILVPGVAFDLKNNRMGYGRGYYDRYLARMPLKNRIGVCYGFQLVEQLETFPHDIPMTRIITE